MKVTAIPAFRDNYVWAIHDDHSAILVDPGEAAPILAWLERWQRHPVAILVTHHHADHVGGIREITARYAIPVYGPGNETIPGRTHPLLGGETVQINELGLAFQVLATPGHTLGHLCYFQSRASDSRRSPLPLGEGLGLREPFMAEHETFMNGGGQPAMNGYGHGALFCGDTLFSCGCGRLFEGTPAQMHASLSRIKALPAETLVYCAHEYTLENLDFALAVEPNNPALQTRLAEVRGLRGQGIPSLPVSLSTEIATNPFLRFDEPSVIVAAAQHAEHPVQPGLEAFTTVRAWRDGY
ncbi:MAG: hydroxyacylglutathione hydrolase [Pseudomonadota bacterium]|nr:hydroxyacylglutathione hydrolase [Pseudomonadota bacterium]